MVGEPGRLIITAEHRECIIDLFGFARQVTLSLKYEVYGQNVKINGYDESGTTALHFAVAADHLIKIGATPNFFNTDGHSLLHLAAEILNTEMTDLLLEV